jgi:hypothetical protein
MLWQRLNVSDPEKLFIIVKNTEGSTLNADDVVAWATAPASVDGVAVRQPDTSHPASIVGVLDAALANGSYGLCQVYGYRSTSRIFQTNTSQDTGVFLEASLGAAHLSSYASSQTIASNTTVSISHRPGPWFVLAESIASSAASGTISAKMFVRCL